MNDEDITSSFDKLRSKVLESTFSDKERLADNITNLEFEFLRENKKRRDKLRDLLLDIRKQYRPIRDILSTFSTTLSSQIDNLSDKCTDLENQIR